MCEIIRQKQIEDSIKQEFDQTLQDRVARYLQVRHHEIIPNMSFAAASAECSLLFRDGYFYAYIALAQAVAEAIVRFLCEVEFGKHGNSFEKNVKKLSVREFISDKLKKAFLQIWRMRNDYHHMNPNIETDRHELEKLAKNKIQYLAKIEGEIFHFTNIDCNFVPEKPKYWKKSGDQVNVYLKIDP